MIFSTFLKLCNRQLYQVQKHFITSKGNPAPIKQSLPLPRPHALGTTNLLSISTDLPSLGISY